MDIFTLLKRCGKIHVLLGFLFIVSMSACNSASTVVKPSPTPSSPVATLSPTRYRTIEHMNVAYGPLTAEKLDLCEPVGVLTPRPGVLIIHGGGWTELDKSDPFAQTVCTSLAAQGFVVASVNYRLAGSTPNGQPLPKNMWPAQLVDVQLAVRWMRAYAQHIGLDPTRLCAQGTSSGAHLAVFLGSLATNHPGDEASLLVNESPKVSCVVDDYGPVDLTKVVYPDSYFGLFGGAYVYNSALLRDASPVLDVSAQSAPTLIIQGTKDTLVPPSQALELYNALQHNHVPVQYISYNGGHAFQGMTQQQFASIVTQTDAFLITHLHP